MEYWVLWLIVVVLLCLIEAATINLVSIWFIASGIVSLVISLFVDSFLVQFGIFVILGILLLFLTRKPLLDMIDKQNEKINLERVIGMTGIVTVEIKKNVVGEIKVDGKTWSAISSKKIKVGEEATVLSIDGVKLVVEKVPNETKKGKKK